MGGGMEWRGKQQTTKYNKKERRRKKRDHKLDP
jgi:hypothetical protein